MGYEKGNILKFLREKWECSKGKPCIRRLGVDSYSIETRFFKEKYIFNKLNILGQSLLVVESKHRYALCSLGTMLELRLKFVCCMTLAIDNTNIQTLLVFRD